MANTVSVVDKPIEESVKEDASVLGIQDDGTGRQVLYRFPVASLLTDRCNAPKGKVKGENAVYIDDISPVEHPLDIEVASKNLMPSSREVRLTEGEYTLSFKVKEDADSPEEAVLGVTYDDGPWWLTMQTFTLSPGESYSYTFAADNAVYDFASSDCEYVQLELGGEATEYTPYVEDIDSVTLSYHGKNLIDVTAVTNRKGAPPALMYFDGILQWCWSEDYYIIVPVFIPQGTEVTLTPGSDALYSYRLKYSDGEVDTKGSTMYNFTPKKDVTHIHLYLKTTGTEVMVTAPELMLRVGGDESYESYRSSRGYPNTTIISDTSGVRLEVTYNRDLNKVLERIEGLIASIGGSNV